MRRQRNRLRLRDKFLVALFVSCLLFIAVMVMSIRPAPVQTGTGTISSKTFVPAHNETRSGRVGRGGSHASRIIHYGDAYHFELAVDGLSEPVTGSVPGRTNDLQVGQPVTVVYEETGFWPFWRHNTLVKVSAT